MNFLEVFTYLTNEIKVHSTRVENAEGRGLVRSVSGYNSGVSIEADLNMGGTSIIATVTDGRSKLAKIRLSDETVKTGRQALDEINGLMLDYIAARFESPWSPIKSAIDLFLEPRTGNYEIRCTDDPEVWKTGVRFIINGRLEVEIYNLRGAEYYIHMWHLDQDGRHGEKQEIKQVTDIAQMQRDIAQAINSFRNGNK